MKYYYYKIQNQLNNKMYIGITENPILRKQQHWRRLNNNTHPNPKLSHAVNKYGLENFVFDIIETKDFFTKEEGYEHERKLIEKFNTLEEGYNCNPGGTWTGPKARFNKNQIFFIKSACYYNDKICGVISRFYGVSIDIIAGIRANRNYSAWGKEFDELSEEEKKDLYNEFCNLTGFEEWKNKSCIKPNSRLYTKEEVFIILLWCEKKFTKAREICDVLKIKYPENPDYRCANKFRNIREGLVYKDYKKEYESLNDLEKQKIERLYAEKRIENLVNCGEP